MKPRLIAQAKPQNVEVWTRRRIFVYKRLQKMELTEDESFYTWYKKFIYKHPTMSKILNIFFEQDDKENKKEAPVSAPSTPTPQIVVNSVDTNPYTAEYKEQLWKVLADENKRNFPGNDYFEFFMMKSAMRGISDERTKYEAAYQAWKVSGEGDKAKLIDTANAYLSLVEREIKEFEEAYQTQYAGQVTKNEQIITLKSTEVEQLLQKVNNLNSEIAALKQQNTDNTAKLSTRHTAFLQAGEAQKQEILTEISRITNYIN